jgi:hypothetical protein
MINPDPYYRRMYDFELRECIGKTEDIHESLCMHSAIVSREMAAKGIIVCRVCNKSLNNHEARYNDHKVLRHSECIQPICNMCAKERPDAFHLAFKKGDELMHLISPPLYIKAARIWHEIDQQTLEEREKYSARKNVGVSI